MLGLVHQLSSTMTPNKRLSGKVCCFSGEDSLLFATGGQHVANICFAHYKTIVYWNELTSIIKNCSNKY